jgi:transposase-like protein
MDREQHHFTDEFKREAVALLLSSDRLLVQISGERGILPSMLRNWRKGRNVRSTLHPI